jgi:hypothetical protein
MFAKVMEATEITEITEERQECELTCPICSKKHMMRVPPLLSGKPREKAACKECLEAQDYQARDAVYYDYFTTLEGVMEKEDPNNPEFIVDERLKDLFQSKDYGRYSIGDEMPVCFTTNNDITGGNSGSPVINSNGELIGVAFDGNWEAMSSDLAFEPELQKCINVDIRYVLFVIDKFAGATHLIEEMHIVE